MTYRQFRWYISFHKNFLAARGFGLAKQLAGFKTWATWGRYLGSYGRYRKLLGHEKHTLAFYPMLGEDTATHKVDYDYIYQNAWAFAEIVGAHPARHVDIGSQLQFCAMLSAILEVTSIDLRTVVLDLPNFTARQGDIKALPLDDASVESLSSLCVVEHIGLGRYGDELDPQGTASAIAELKRVLAPQGKLYISVPMDDEERTYFNAHRAFTTDAVKKMLHPLKIVDAKYIYGPRLVDEPQTGFGTGCFVAQKE